MKWDTHCLKISKAFSLNIRKMFQMKDMPKSTLSTIYFQGILPSALYGILIWGNCSQTLMNSIEKIHVRAARFIHYLKKSTPHYTVLEKANWKPICHYYKRSIACKAYKTYNGLSSPLLSNLNFFLKFKKVYFFNSFIIHSKHMCFRATLYACFMPCLI